MAGVPFEAVFLLKDLHGEKVSKILKTYSHKPVYRGELLLPLSRNKVTPRRDGKPAHNYQIACDPAVTVFCIEDVVAPLDEQDYNLLAAVKSREARFEVFQKDRLDWGMKLKYGDLVYATLPSKSPVPNQQVASKIKFIGPLPNENGVFFGVEIVNPKYRGHGSSNGSFGELQFFQCEENAGMFVSLDRLSPMDLEQPQLPPADGRQHHMTTRSQGQDGQPSQPDNQRQNHLNPSSTPKQPLFKLGDRVVAYDKKGAVVLGSVRWMGKANVGVGDVPVVGIETDIAVQSKEFVGALLGLGYFFRCKDSRHGKLVLPETMVTLEHEDAARREKQKQLKKECSVDRGAEDVERDIERAMKQSEVEYLRGASPTAVVNHDELDRVLKEYEKANEEKQKRLSGNKPDRNSGSHYEQIPTQHFIPPPYRQQPTSRPENANLQLSSESRDPGAPPFSIGSMVQMTTNPPRYGVVRWMGTLEGIRGQIAGVELEEPIELCQDGTWQGIRYFSCRQGHGFFCPVSSLEPDQRFAPSTSAGATVNPKQRYAEYAEKTNEALKLFEATLKQQQKEYDTQMTQMQQDSLKKAETLAQLEQQLSEAKAEITSLLTAKQTLEAKLKTEKDSSAQIQQQLSVSKAEQSSFRGAYQQLQEELIQDRESLSQYKQQLSEAKAEVASLQSAQEESVAFGIEPWKVPRDTVQVGRVIGGGGWGVVNEGKLQVAVKQFYPNILSERNILRLKREMRMLALVRHPNLLQFIAAVFDDGGDHRRNPPYIITELLDGSLRSTYETQVLPKSSLLSIFQDTARALDYLHRRYEPIIHRDVSSANVLLKQLSDDKWIAKLSDLGSANLAKEAYTMNEGARVYCAPEAFTFDTDARSTGTLTPKVDVYSYGIMLCEVATRTFPEKDEYPKMLDRLRREWPQLHQLVLSCTKPSPEQRPSMATVLSQLEGFPPQH